MFFVLATERPVPLNTNEQLPRLYGFDNKNNHDGNVTWKEKTIVFCN